MNEVGKVKKGRVIAEYRELAMDKLIGEGYVVIELNEVVENDIALRLNSARKWINKKLSGVFNKGIKKKQIDSLKEELDLIGYRNYEISDMLRGVSPSTFDIDEFRKIVPELDDIQVEKIRSGRTNRDRRTSLSTISEAKFTKKMKWTRGVSDDELVLFTEMLALSLENGVDLVKALYTIQKDMRSERLKTALDNVIYDLSNGSELSEALSAQDTIFHDFYIALVKIGESGGSSLPVALNDLTKFLKMRRFVKTEFVKASLYPAFLFVAVSAVLVFLSVFLIPKLSEIYESFGFQLPWLTTVIFSIADHFLVIFSMVILSLIALGISIFKVDVVRNKLSGWLDYWVLRIPVVKTMMNQLLMFQLNLTLAITLKNGIPMLDSLDLVNNVVSNKYLKKDIEKVYYDIVGGNGLADSFENREYIDSMTKMAIRSGDESGMIHEALEKMSDHYDKKLAVSIEKMVNLMTPVSLVIMGLIVGPVVIGVMLPIVSLSGQISSLN